MSVQSSTPVMDAGAVRRPTSVRVTAVLAVVIGLASLINGIMMAFFTKSLLAQAVADEVGMPVDQVETMLDSPAAAELVGDGLNTLATRGYLALAAGVLLVVGGLVFGKLLAGGKALGARLVVTIAALLTAGVGFIVMADEGTVLMAMLGALSVFGAIAAMLLPWMPGIGRYANAKSITSVSAGS